MCLGADGWRVHVRDPVVELVHRAERQPDIPRVERRRETVLHIVVDGERFVGVVDAKNGQHRTKHLLLLEAHARLDTREDRRLEKESSIVLLTRWPAAAAEQIGSLRLSDVDVALDLLPGALVYQRPDIGPLLSPVAELQRARAVDESTEELIMNSLLQDETTRRGTPLAGRAERTPPHASEREA